MNTTRTEQKTYPSQFTVSRSFKWTAKRSTAAIALANGYTHAEAAAQAGVARTTIHNWLQWSEFAQEVDRLSLMVGIAQRAERLRLAQRVIRERGTRSDRDLLDWLRYAQSETEGIRLDLVGLLDASTLTEDGVRVAGSRQAGSAEAREDEQPVDAG